MEEIYTYILAGVGIALIAALIMLLVQRKKMKTVATEYFASRYLTGVDFVRVADTYLRTTETRRYSPEEKKNN